MVYKGHVEKGVVVFDDPVTLPDGLKVQIEPLAPAQAEEGIDNSSGTLGRKFLKHAGKTVGLPADLAENHDHYLYGTPKR